MLAKLIRLLKALDAWFLDLLFPDVGQDDDTDF
jgi:hypothetical protein